LAIFDGLKVSLEQNPHLGGYAAKKQIPLSVGGSVSAQHPLFGLDGSQQAGKYQFFYRGCVPLPWLFLPQKPCFLWPAHNGRSSVLRWTSSTTISPVRSVRCRRFPRHVRSRACGVIFPIAQDARSANSMNNPVPRGEVSEECELSIIM